MRGRGGSHKRNLSAADRTLVRIEAALRAGEPLQVAAAEAGLLAGLIAEDLAARGADGNLVITAAGEARLRRLAAAATSNGVDPFRAQHLPVRVGRLAAGDSAMPRTAVLNEAESPLGWLARRKGRGGQALIAPAQFQAGERLRADFTFAQLTPRMSVDWTSPLARSTRGGGSPETLADAVVAARQRLRHALDAAGPEFAGLLMDVCCFLKGLEDVERERGWPPRAGKIVLQLALDRLARHYGLAGEARGREHVPVRSWLAEGARFNPPADEAAAE